MTPKEKAASLTHKFIPHVKWHCGGRKLEEAKSCALICVDECLKEHCHESENKDPNAQDRWIEYWQNVKRELSLL
jgi:hypothetical protein